MKKYIYIYIKENCLSKLFVILDANGKQEMIALKEI